MSSIKQLLSHILFMLRLVWLSIGIPIIGFLWLIVTTLQETMRYTELRRLRKELARIERARLVYEATLANYQMAKSTEPELPDEPTMRGELNLLNLRRAQLLKLLGDEL